MKYEINNLITELFKPSLNKIKEQTNCNHIWLDKNGSAYFRCNNCGYLADNMELDKLITINNLVEKGATPEMIKLFKKYI